MTLNDLMERCRVEDGHWIWIGAASRGVPRIWAPDFTQAEGRMTSQPGRRAVWHVKTGKPIPEGWRVFGTCDRPDCIAPGHIVCRDPAVEGRKVAASGKLKGRVGRKLAARKTGRARSKLDLQLIEFIKTSPLTGEQVAAQTGLSTTTVSKVRKHGAPSFEPIGGIFSGLLAANDASTRRTAP